MTHKLSEATKAVRRDFVAYLKTRYVIDESGNFPRAISASGRPQNLTALTFEFTPWAKEHPERKVPEEEFNTFISGLETYIRARLTRVCGTSFKPVNERAFVDSKGDTLLNTYLPYAPARPENYGQCKAKLDKFADRLFHQNPNDRKHVLQFCADTIQNPARRPQFGIIMRGAPGTGKSSLIGLLKVALGNRYVWSENDYAPVFQRFSQVLPDHLVVCFDDASASKNTPEDLKLAITRDTANVEVKGVQIAVEREVYARVWVLSNKNRPFMLPADDRRFYVTDYLDHYVDFADSETYFEEFTSFWKNPENAAAIYWWFRDADLTGFTPHSCMKTAARKQLIAMSTSGADAVISEFLGGTEVTHIDAEGFEQSETPPVRTVFHKNEILATLQTHRIKEIPHDMLTRKLTEAGYETKRRSVPGCNNGKQIEVWSKIMPGQVRAPSLSEAEIFAISTAYNNDF